MKLSEALKGLAHVMRRARLSKKTHESYAGWVSRYWKWCADEFRKGRKYQAENGEERISSPLDMAKNITPIRKTA